MKMVDLKQLMTYGVSLIAGLIASITENSEAYYHK
jgi:hypothetical protein